VGKEKISHSIHPAARASRTTPVPPGNLFIFTNPDLLGYSP
jgi:hypothetical protein